MIYVIVKDGKVVNRTKSSRPLGDDWIQSDTAQIGDIYEKGSFHKPTKEESKPPVPGSVSAKDLRLGLVKCKFLSETEAMLASAEGEEGEAARIEWEYSTDIARSSNLMKVIIAQTGLTEEQADDIFRTTIEASSWNYPQLEVAVVSKTVNLVTPFTEAEVVGELKEK